jgi:hypothetical protein
VTVCLNLARQSRGPDLPGVNRDQLLVEFLSVDAELAELWADLQLQMAFHTRERRGLELGSRGHHLVIVISDSTDVGQRSFILVSGFGKSIDVRNLQKNQELW